MPLRDVVCPDGHEHEILLSFGEEREAEARYEGNLKVPCPEPGCTKLAQKQLSLTGSMKVQWRRAAHGGSSL